MPDETTSSALLDELIEHLLYVLDDAKEWKRLLHYPITDPHSIPGHLGRITREGIKAGVSEALAHVVVLRYAESESVNLTPERISGIIASEYKMHARRQAEQQKKNDAGNARN